MTVVTEAPYATGGPGPCADWPVYWTCDVCALSPALTGLAVASASEILFNLSGRQFGVCEVTSRPCRDSCTDWFLPYGWLPWTGAWTYPQPALIGGLWFNLTCGSCSGDCSCTRVSQVVLPAQVWRVVQVKVDGSVLPSTAYRLDNRRLLVRTDGGEWPLCNDLSKDDTESGTWSVTAQYGRPIPDSARAAVGELACELMKAMRGEDCRMPAGVTQLARQGVTISFPDVGELWSKGRTGLYLVDAFLSSVNPHGLARRSRVYAVDNVPFRRPTP